MKSIFKKNVIMCLFLALLFAGCVTFNSSKNINNGSSEVDITNQNVQVDNQILQNDVNIKKELDNLENSDNPSEFIAKSDEYCKQDYPSACYNMGLMSYQGYFNVPKNIEKAKEYFNFGCEVNHALSCHKLGALLKLEGKISEAIKLFEKSSNLGYAGGDFSLGLLYASSNPDKSEGYFIKSCNENFGPGCSKLASVYRLKGDKEGAFGIDTKACNLNDPKGCFNLATTNYLEQKYEEALALYTKGCELGSYSSCERAVDMIQKDQVFYSKEEKTQMIDDINKTIENNQKISKFQL